LTKSSTLFLAFCCFCTPGSFAAAQSASEQEVVPANGGARVLDFTSLRVRFGLAQAIEGAAHRLRRPECRRVFSDFKDASENLLETNLIRFAVDPADYLLKFIWFADGSQQSQCWGMTAAFTEPGSRVVFVCGRHFDQNSREAELQIIHEILHTLGLGENPPSSGAITKQVIARCGVSNSRPVSKARGSDAKTLGPTPTLDQRRKFEREIAAWIAVAGSQAKPQLAALPLTVAIHDSAALPPPVLERAKRGSRVRWWRMPCRPIRRPARIRPRR
jgi:hypothetical protein